MLLFIEPIAVLKPYVTRIWLFENEYGLPENNLIAPNARPKIILPFIGSITTRSSAHSRVCDQDGIYFIGIRDMPVALTTAKAKSGSIGIEFRTEAAYKFIDYPMREVVNDVFSFRDCFGREGIDLAQEIKSIANPYSKIDRLQTFLVYKLKTINRSNPVVDFSINLISKTHGLIGVRELERRTGYTKRYIDMLFREHLGIPPKTFSTIVRFQHFYKVMLHTGKDSIYDLYYDESHFIREFKRYTGYSPTRFATLPNDFGKHF